MRSRFLVLALSACALALGADWSTWRFDPQRTGWQRDERVLNTRTATKLALLWKREFSNLPAGLADPLILGPIITQRGIKELVLAKTSSDVVYAIDADLNRVFWSRDLTEGARTSSSTCSGDSRVTPSMAPSVIRPKTSTGDDFSDGNKPLFVLSANGDLHALHLRTGEEFGAPLKLLPASARPTTMDVAGSNLFIATSTKCGGVPNRLWTVDVDSDEEQIGALAQSQAIPDYEREKAGGSGVDFQARTAFEWHGKEFLVAVSDQGKLSLQEAKSQPMIFGVPGSSDSPSLATWEDAASNRWIYANLRDSVRAFRVTQGRTLPEFVQAWQLSGIDTPGPPVLANGILYFLSTAGSGASKHLILHAVDAVRGEELYNSGESIGSNSSSKNLAIANGHVSFSTSDGRLYCFGMPFQM
jgi:outer membrane protein assembly factor BamB